MSNTKQAKRWTAQEESNVRNTFSAETIDEHGLAVLIHRSRMTDRKTLAKLARRDSPFRSNGVSRAISPR